MKLTKIFYHLTRQINTWAWNEQRRNGQTHEYALWHICNMSGVLCVHNLASGWRRPFCVFVWIEINWIKVVNLTPPHSAIGPHSAAYPQEKVRNTQTRFHLIASNERHLNRCEMIKGFMRTLASYLCRHRRCPFCLSFNPFLHRIASHRCCYWVFKRKNRHSFRSHGYTDTSFFNSNISLRSRNWSWRWWFVMHRHQFSLSSSFPLSICISVMLAFHH